MGRYTEHLAGEVEYQDAIAGITVATRVKLVLEPDSPDDPRAIKAITTDGVKVGNVPRDSWLVKAMIDHDTPVASRIMAIVPVAPGSALRRIVLEVLTGQDASDALARSAQVAADAAVQPQGASTRLQSIANEQKSQLGARPMSLAKKLLIGMGVLFWGGVVTTAVKFNIANERKPHATQAASTLSAAPTPSPTALSKEERLRALDAKINEVALIPLDEKYDPDGYAKLGKRVWGFSNDYRRWAAFAALQNDGCDYVSAIAVWEAATRSSFSWNVVCGDKRFIISEEQARRAKERFDFGDSVPERASAAPVAEPSKPSKLSETDAVTACIEATTDRIKHPSTADFSILGASFKTFDNGTSIFATTFTARNDFNLELEYQVACDFTGSKLTDVKIEETR